MTLHSPIVDLVIMAISFFITYKIKRYHIAALIQDLKDPSITKQKAILSFVKGSPVLSLFAVLFVASLLLEWTPHKIYSLYSIASGYALLLIFFLAGKGFLIRFGILRPPANKEKQHVRGSQHVEVNNIVKSLHASTDETCIPITKELRIPVRYEPQHFFSIGRPGCGKSQLFYRVIDNVRYRGKKALIYDFKGDMVQKFYRENTDILFNPFDTRCVGWNVFNEIQTRLDCRSIANSLIPVTGNDPYWSNAARDVFASILTACYLHDCKTNADVYEAVNLPCSELYKLLSKIPGCETGARHLEQDRTAQSVLSVMSTSTQCFTYLRAIDGDFSLKRWVQNESDKSALFLTNYSEISDAIKPILSLMIELAGKRGLSMIDDRDRRLFVFLDEFGTLQNLPTIVTMLTNGRSKGMSIWLAIQDMGQIEKLYGRELSQTIVNSCASSFTFAVSDPTTAEFLSKKIGDREVIQTNVSTGSNQNYGRSMGSSSSVNTSTQTMNERVVLPSEIIGMADLQVIVKLPEYNPTFVTLPLITVDTIAQSFIQCDDPLLSQRKGTESIVDRILSKVNIPASTAPTPATDATDEKIAFDNTI